MASEIIRGSGTMTGGTPRVTASTVQSEDGDITLDFANADVRDVAKAIFQDLLKANYVVDAKVQGTMTIQTTRPLKRDAVLSVFEEALRMNGLALLVSDHVYEVVPAADAARQGGVPVRERRHGAAQPGYGVEVVPPRFVSAPDLKRLIEPLAPTGTLLQADAARNVLIIAGSEQERATLLEDIALFDTDWMSGMSFALFVPHSVEAAQLGKELGQVIGGKDSMMGGMVRLIPIERLNILLAISPQARYLEELQVWVDRLDRPSENVDQRIYVYRVQNGRAADLAAVLTKVLGKGGKSGAPSGASPRSGGQTGEDPAFVGRLPVGVAASVPSAVPSEGSDQGVRVSGLMDINITADDVNNALVVLASPKDFAIVESALRQLDLVPLQVFLEAAVAEVTLTKELKYGVQYFISAAKGRHTVALSNSTSATPAATFPGFEYSLSYSNIQVILNALEDVTHVDVVSSPQIMVLNNQTATLQVGDQVPIATQQATNVLTTNATIVNSIQLRDTGVILKVTPRVNQGGMVMLDISQEVSAVAATTSSDLNSPTIQQRKLSSTVAVQDGETIALGGLIQDGKTLTKSGIPLLQDIPYLGAAFRTTDDQGNRTELLVLITPHVVDNTQKARAATQELRDKLPATGPLFQRTQSR